MNRRDFIKAVPVLALATSVTETTTQQPSVIKRFPYYVNCYIQNQKHWPLEEYEGGIFGEGQHKKYEMGHAGEKWVDGKLRFYGFKLAIDFIEIHSLVVPFEHEIAYEIFHERTSDPLTPPKHIYNYWAKINPFKEIKWIRPDYIDHESDGLIEYV
jgi:hypothetical protein|tara:strand:+ start:492 stop:959 length:468 start_codon:yes stop_codon:yes gene_type:complete